MGFVPMLGSEFEFYLLTGDSDEPESATKERFGEEFLAAYTPMRRYELSSSRIG